jgi:hypothetical protein
MPYGNWWDVHLPSGGWRLRHLRVLVPPMPPGDPEQTIEIRCRRPYLSAGFCADPAYAMDSNRWLN